MPYFFLCQVIPHNLLVFLIDYINNISFYFILTAVTLVVKKSTSFRSCFFSPHQTLISYLLSDKLTNNQLEGGCIVKAVATLTSSESKRFIAKAVVQMQEVRKAWESAYLLVADGTTNAFIVQELLQDRSIEAGYCTIGINTDGLMCVNSPKNRKSHSSVFFKGQPVSGRSFAEALADYHENTVIIKGANAIDSQGNIGIITTGFDGGTIPKIIGPISSKGLTLIIPVGLEKLVPSVTNAAKHFNGAKNIDISLGASGGMFCLANTTYITEIEAAQILFNVDATMICCGGVGGNEGAVTFVFEGEKANVLKLVDLLETQVKGEPPIAGVRGACDNCRYADCRYFGRAKDELPAWMRK